MSSRTRTFPTVNGNLTNTRISLDALLGAKVDDAAKDASWSEVEATVVHSIIWAVSHLGGTAQFGVTKNNKAYTLKLYIGKPYDPIYFDGDETGRAEMQALAAALVEMAAAGS